VDRWEPRRASTHSHEFLARLEQLGIDVQAADNVLEHVERVLLGADLNLLEEAYSEDEAGRRMLLTNEAPGVPALRIAFMIDRDGNDQIIYLDCDRR
jgi:hypothetical protein